ncbi:MAG TPA: carbohydrate kinase [Microbacterium sp.]|uniref:carbohydrate kinase family protein n=1 Tax=Microbacterium sp. TaxID=51671 RepID=UPI002B49EC0D|nr:carbohydrate kinase [Microbacterium sp.]HKT57656.1 carbohydrate kinase [Microbacterium sp.]
MRPVLVIGESLIDIVDRGDGTEPVRHVGGSPLNVAFGLGRLDIPTVFATEFGDDADGEAIARHLASAGVRIERSDDGVRPTATAIARIGADGSAEYVFDLDWTFTRPPQPTGLAAVHIGSIGALRTPGSQKVIGFVEALPDDVLVTFDPNIRPALVPPRDDTRDLVERYAARAGIVKLSDEDAEWLYPGRADAVAQILLERGARLVAVTRGAEGSTLHTASATVDVPARPTRPVDTIGAGDAFMAGLLAAVVGGGGVQDVLDGGLTPADLSAIGRIAAVAASITVSRAGAMPPTAAELERHVQEPYVSAV